jgi:predicted  nucleic acid-binding Zn-ribbon protein
MTNLSEVADELQKALEHAKKAHQTLEAAKAKLEPLSSAAKEADNAVAVLMNQYTSLTTGEAPRGRRGSTGPRKAYNITPESKIAATEKRQYTRAINAGKSESEAKKIGKEAAKALAAKLGVK